MKQLLTVLLLVCCLTAVFAETASKPEPDLDLTDLSGSLLMDRLSEIRSDPETYAGYTGRVRGQYYGQDSEDEVRRSLIVCDTCHCAEIGIALAAAEGTEISWPENNQTVEITATVEVYETSAGELSARLAVISMIPC